MSDQLQSLSDLSAPSPNAGSELPAADDLTCPVCGRACRSKLGLQAHMRAHDGKAPPDPGDVQVKKALTVKPSLKEVQSELAGNLKTIGQLLHGALYSLKLVKLQNPDARLRVPLTGIDTALPDFDTHLAWTISLNSELTAKLLTEHAASNETLLKWLVRFNGWFKGGETGSLVGAHLTAAASSLGISNGLLHTVESALIPDVLERVQAENYQLRQQVQELLTQRTAAAASRDERGAGN